MLLLLDTPLPPSLPLFIATPLGKDLSLPLTLITPRPSPGCRLATALLSVSALLHVPTSPGSISGVSSVYARYG